MDPVTLGLCSQIDLDFEVNSRQQGKAGAAEHRRDAAAGGRNHRAQGSRRGGATAASENKPGGELDVSAVFAKLKQLGGKAEKDDE